MDDAPNTDDLNLQAVSSRTELHAKIRKVHLRADKPSLRKLEARTRLENRPLTKNIAGQILNGTRFPGRYEMLSLLRACGIQANLEPWLRAWERVAESELDEHASLDRDGQGGATSAALNSEDLEGDIGSDIDEISRLRGELGELREENVRINILLRSIQANLIRDESPTRPTAIHPVDYNSDTSRVLDERFKLVYKLSSGGMGSVWLAEDLLLGRSVALKELAAPYGLGFGDDARTARKRALREAQALARVRHSAVVPIHDLFFVGEDPWIVMEYIEGRALDRILQENGPLGEHEIARIGLQVALALSAIHESGVLHRDVKPANILTTDEDRVYLVDFGISTIAEGQSLTRANSVIGTLDFMSPERLEGRKTGSASDLWSLGITFFVMLEGHIPFRHTEPSATLRAILHDALPPFSRQGRLTELISQLMSKDPAQRPTAKDVAAALREIVSGPA